MKHLWLLFFLALLPTVRAESHAALAATVEVNVPLNPRYAGKAGTATLVDGEIAENGYGGGIVLGFEGLDVEITVTLDEPIPVRTIAADFLQITPPAIYLPVSVDFAVSENGTNFRTVATVLPKATEQDAGPLHERLQVTDLDITAKAVRVRASNGGRVPPDHRAPQALRWTFISEVLVNPGDKPRSVWDAVRNYQFGASRTALTRIETMLRTGPDPDRQDALVGLRSLLADAATTADAKRFACSMLAIHGGQADVPAVAALLPQADLRAAALPALASLGGPEAEKAVLAALPDPAAVTAAVAFASPDTVQALAKLLPDPAVGELAARTLAQVRQPATVTVLADRFAAAPSPWLAEALLAAADREEVPEATRTAALRAVIAHGSPTVRLAAAGALLRRQPDPDALQVLFAAVPGSGAVTLLGECVERHGVAALGKGFGDLPGEVRSGLVGHETSIPWLLAQLDAPEAPFRLAVIRQLGKCGDGTAVSPLCARLAGADEAEGKVLIDALTNLRGQTVDAQSLELAPKLDPKARPAMAEVCRRREMTVAGPLVLAWTEDGSLPDGWRVLATLAEPDLCGPIAAALAKRPAEREAIGRALLAVARRSPPTVAPVLAAQFGQSQDSAEREILLQALAILGDLPTLRQALDDPAPEVRLAAIRGLGETKIPTYIPVLLAAADAPDPRQNALALRAVCRLLDDRLDPLQATGIVTGWLVDAKAKARRPEEQQQVAEIAARIPQAELLAVVAGQPAAYVTLAEAVWPDAPSMVREGLSRILETTQDADLKARAQTVLDRMTAFAPFLSKLEANPWQGAFNGTDLTGWQPVNGKPDSWSVVNGLLVANAGGGGWLARTEEMGDYLFELDVRLPPGGNSGFFLRPPLQGNPAWEGIEVQMLDDAAPEYAGKLRADQYCASIYGMGPAQPGLSRPADQWQRLRVLCAGRHVAVWLNGRPAAYAALDDHLDQVGKIPGLKRASGFPGLQNEHGPIQFRNLRYRDLR